MHVSSGEFHYLHGEEYFDSQIIVVVTICCSNLYIIWNNFIVWRKEFPNKKWIRVRQDFCLSQSPIAVGGARR